jgi:hypothetical protein
VGGGRGDRLARSAGCRLDHTGHRLRRALLKRKQLAEGGHKAAVGRNPVHVLQL